jgi:DNA-binding NarL/FixJ family response regulator
MIRILVVDDHPILRAGLEAVLRAEPGFVCVGTASGADDAWPLVRRARPDVVIVDRFLDGEDGLALCRALRGEPAAPRVLVYTAQMDPGLETEAREAGAHGAMEKTADVDELFDAIRLAARGNRTAA